MSEKELNRTVRHARKKNRIGPGASCEICGEHDVRVLQRVGNRLLCADCRLEIWGRAASENHHPAGKNNDDFSISLPANDHAILSDDQYDWPGETLRNPDQDPLREIAAWFRGIHDLLIHFAEKLLIWASGLEGLSTFLKGMFGPDWVSRVNKWKGEDDDGSA
jgi:hypothetical protein